MPPLARIQYFTKIAIIVLSLIMLPLLSSLIVSGTAEPPRTAERVAASCANLKLERARLFQLAKACREDSDCKHYGGSCFATAKGPDRTTLEAVEETLARGCEVPRTFSDCGRTVAVCVEYACSVRPIE